MGRARKENKELDTDKKDLHDNTHSFSSQPVPSTYELYTIPKPCLRDIQRRNRKGTTEERENNGYVDWLGRLVSLKWAKVSNTPEGS